MFNCLWPSQKIHLRKNFCNDCDKYHLLADPLLICPLCIFLTITIGIFFYKNIGARWATKSEKGCYLSLFASCEEFLTCKKLSSICRKVSSLDVYFELELYFMTLYSRVGMRYAVKTTRSRVSKGNFQPSAHLDIVAAYAGDILRRRSLLVFRGKLVLDCWWFLSTHYYW